MGIIIVVIVYLIYTAFLLRFVMHALIWCKNTTRARSDNGLSPMSCRVFALLGLDLVFFRRLFNSSKALWSGSWTFHLCFFLVLLRHLRYFMSPVPDCIIFLQPLGLAAGYVLPFSLINIIVARLTGRDRYLSWSNFFVIGLVFLISISGLLMRTVFSPDLVDVKAFVLGILTFRPDALPESFLFTLHILLFLILIPYLPFHIFTAPAITLDAIRREQGLRMVLHDR